jgi:exodeoxyribonuclease-1
MLFRYRARNFPASLSEAEQQLWGEHCFSRLTEPQGGGSIVMDAYNESIERQLSDPELADEKRLILHALQEYGDMLLC